MQGRMLIFDMSPPLPWEGKRIGQGPGAYPQPGDEGFAVLVISHNLHHVFAHCGSYVCAQRRAADKEHP